MDTHEETRIERQLSDILKKIEDLKAMLKIAKEPVKEIIEERAARS